MTNLDAIDPTFESDLRGSDPSVLLIARWLREKHGKTVVIPPLLVRPSVEQRGDYADGADLAVLMRVQVKRRPTLHFTCRADYPYQDGIIVDVAYLWDRMLDKPLFYAILNKDSTHAAIVKQDTSKHWTKRTLPSRGRDREHYICPLEHVSFCELSI